MNPKDDFNEKLFNDNNYILKKTANIRLRNLEKEYKYKLYKIRQQTAQEIFKDIEELYDELEEQECFFEIDDIATLKQKYLGGKE